ncbi:MAG: hypothetical protein K6G67_04975 [Lachnospiraceae bacterium]|nr:hypothetical protein [Lachnospiraceae bacterium]
MDRKTAAVLISLVFSAFALTACGRNTASWAYIHEPEKEILALSDNGKAVYKGSNYTYTKDASFITLKGSDGSEVKMRYVPDDKDEGKMTLYEKKGYNFKGEGHPDSVIGVWFDDNERSSYQFTEKGTFTEDNIFYGHFFVDENEKTIKLMYDEPMEDTILYYELDGDRLTIDYPWPMVKTK